MIQRNIFQTLVALCLFSTGFQAYALPAYSISDLVGLVGSEGSRARAVNDFGQVVGDSYFDDTIRATYWDNGIATDLSPIGHDFSLGNDINNNNRIGGSASRHSVLASEVFGLIGVPAATTTLEQAGILSNHGTTVTAINEAGHIIGEIDDGNGFFYGDSGLVEYSAPNLAVNGLHMVDINDNGRVVGRYTQGNNAVSFIGDTNGNILTELDSFEGGSTSVTGINDNNLVTGHSTNAAGRFRAFIGDENGITDLDTAGNFTNSIARAINDNSSIVGSASYLDVGGQQHSGLFLWTEEDGMILLRDLIDDLSGWDRLRVATDISNTGYIVGYGNKTNGETHGFLLSPIIDSFFNNPDSDPDDDPDEMEVSEPGMFILIFLGLILLTRSRLKSNTA